MIYSPKSVYLLYLWELFCRIQQIVATSTFKSFICGEKETFLSVNMWDTDCEVVDASGHYQ